MILIIIAILTMAASDFFDTCMTIAESRNRPVLAGASAAGANTLSFVVGIIGADSLITHGVAPAVILGLAVLLTNFVATWGAAKWAAGKIDLGT